MGTDKALLPWHGRPLISYAADTLRAVIRDVCVVSDYADRYGFLGLPNLPDIIRESGPLGGIHAALTQSGSPSVFVLSCDMPLVSRSLVEYVLQYPSAAQVTVVAMYGRIQPLCGMYHASCLPVFEQELKHRRRKMMDVIARVHHTVVQIGPGSPFHDTRLLMNVNDEQRYRELTAWTLPGT